MSKASMMALVGSLNNEPLLLAPRGDLALASDLRALMTHEDNDADEGIGHFLLDLAAVYGVTSWDERKPFAFHEGIAYLPVHGLLLNRFPYACSYATGYSAIRRMFDAAVADHDVKGVVFDFNSGGGDAQGCFELCDHIHANRKKKPMKAVVDANAYSAAYALASAVGNISVTPSGGAGSIGVITMHVDMSKMLENIGIKVNLIYKGKHKADGNPFEPLPKDVRKDIEARIEARYEAFVAQVARNRGLDADKVRATEAQCFMADEALALGLIDAVAPPQTALASFVSELSGSTFSTSQEMDMSNETKPGAATTEAPKTVAPATPAPAAAAPAATDADAKKAERERINAILTCDEAKNSPGLANHLALNTELSVEDAKKALAAAKPATPAAAAPNAFERAMATTENPNVGADAGADPNKPKDQVALFLGDYQKATGVDLRKH